MNSNVYFILILLKILDITETSVRWTQSFSVAVLFIVGRKSLVDQSLGLGVDCIVLAV